MKLHEGKELFKAALDYASLQSGISPDIIEKDYYVFLILEEISKKQKDIPIYFKGGTALYKIGDEMRRFSEDIDLTVNICGMTKSKAKKTLEKASQYEPLERLKGDPMEENKKGSITTVYGYDSVYPNKKDSLQRFGKVKIEATSFTVSAPVQSHTIYPLIVSISDQKAREYLKKMECNPISIQTISIERMFADKFLAAEFYYEREKWFDVAKHVYDIHFMCQLPEIKKMLNDDADIIHYFSYKRIEEIARLGSDLNEKPLTCFEIYSVFQNDSFIEAFNLMQDIYVFQEKYKYNLESIKETFKYLKNIFDDMSDREQKFIKSDEFMKMTSEMLPYSAESNNKVVENNETTFKNRKERDNKNSTMKINDIEEDEYIR